MSDVALVTPGCGAVEKKMYCMAVSRATERSCAAAAELKTMQGGGSRRGLGGATPSARELHGWGCGEGVGGAHPLPSLLSSPLPDMAIINTKAAPQ